MSDLSDSLHGFMLLQVDPSTNYRGVDRHPFEPEIIDEELDPSLTLTEDSDSIWSLYPAGWRREAYRLFTADRLPGVDLALLRSRQGAIAVASLIPVNAGRYEIVECWVSPTSLRSTYAEFLSERLLGFDVAYPGGDYYSAVRNGLHVNPHPGLLAKYGQLTNTCGLFQSADQLDDFIDDFRRSVPTESDSGFVAYALHAVS